MASLLKELRFALYLTLHPFDAYWDLKHEKRGSLRTAIVIFVLFNLVLVAENLFTGYIFGGRKDVDYNMFSTFWGTFGVLALFCVGNWGLTCLSDGKGTMYDICTATAYALVPYILIHIPMIFLSNFFVQREATFYTVFGLLSTAWCAFLLLVSQIQTHQYTLLRALIVIFATFVAMMAMACLLILFVNLLQQVVVFVSIIVEEIYLRIKY